METIAAGGFALAGATSDSLPEDPHVALLEIKGEIKDLSKQTAWLHRLRHADGIKGLLVRVDSSGGSAAVSEVFYEELLEFGKEKPVVVSMGSMAASGGLMISMAGERIFAGGGTVTGSIGVIMQSLHNEKLLDTLGIGYLLYTTGPDKAAGNPMRAPTDAEKEYLQKFMAEICDQFPFAVEYSDVPLLKSNGEIPAFPGSDFNAEGGIYATVFQTESTRSAALRRRSAISAKRPACPPTPTS